MPSAYALGGASPERRFVVCPSLEVSNEIEREAAAMNAAQCRLNVPLEMAYAHAEGVRCLALG
jgi:hypothetical protein